MDARLAHIRIEGDRVRFNPKADVAGYPLNGFHLNRYDALSFECRENSSSALSLLAPRDVILP